MTTATESNATDAITADGVRPGDQIEAYVRRCRPHLDDLAGDVQAQLLADIREIVAEVATELNGAPDDLVGSPARFTRELRSAAGLPLRFAATDAPATADEEVSAFAEVLSALTRWGRLVALPWLRQLAHDLRPAWWVVRGVGLAFLVDLDHRVGMHGLFPNLLGSQLAWFVLAAALIVGSVEVGRRGRPRTWFGRAALVLVGVAAIAALVGSINRTSYVDSVGAATVPIPPIQEYDPIQTFSVRVSSAETGEIVYDSGVAPIVDLLADFPRHATVEQATGFIVEVPDRGEVFADTWENVVDLVHEFARASF